MGVASFAHPQTLIHLVDKLVGLHIYKQTVSHIPDNSECLMKVVGLLQD